MSMDKLCLTILSLLKLIYKIPIYIIKKVVTFFIEMFCFFGAYFLSRVMVFGHNFIWFFLVILWALCILSMQYFNYDIFSLPMLSSVKKILIAWSAGIAAYVVATTGVSVSFYSFFFNAQKNISEASTRTSEWGIKTALTLYFISICIAFPEQISLKYLLNSKNYDDVLLVSLFFITALFIVNIYCSVERMNPINLFDYVIYRHLINYRALQTRLWVKHLNKALDETLVDYLIYSVTGIFQILISLCQKNMMLIFEEKYNKWKRNAVFLGMDIDVSDNENLTIKFVTLMSSEYARFYKAVLRGQLSLIKALYNGNHLKEGNEAVTYSFSLSLPVLQNVDLPSEIKEDLFNEYILVSVENALYFYKNKISLIPILNYIKDRASNEQEYKGIISVYRIMLIKAIENNDINAVISLVYDLVRTIEETDKKDDDILQLEQQEVTSSNYDYIGMAIYIFISCAVKSIELGYTDIVGFFVKFIVSNFDSTLTEKALHNFKENKSKDIKFDDDYISSKIGINGFKINNKTDSYCMEKFVILLFGQQLYVGSKNVRVGKIPNCVIMIHQYISINCIYIFRKMCLENYGLFWINSKLESEVNFRKKLENILKRNVANKEQTNLCRIFLVTVKSINT